MSDLLASVDGAITPAAEAMVPVEDAGVLRGDGAFEVMRVYGGRPFAWEEHFGRLVDSAARLRLELDVSAIAGDVQALLDAVPGFDGQVRFFVTRGGHRVALLEEARRHTPTVSLATVEYVPTRILDGIKSLSYAANMLATRIAQERGAQEALLITPHGRVLEAPTSAFFYVLDGGLFTPPLEDHILDSITRRHVLSDTRASERITTTDDLARVTEAFLASTTREVQPVASIDGRALPAPPGALTAAAARAFRRRVAA